MTQHELSRNIAYQMYRNFLTKDPYVVKIRNNYIYWDTKYSSCPISLDAFGYEFHSDWLRRYVIDKD